MGADPGGIIATKYPSDIMEAVRQHLGLEDKEDTSRDKEIDAMSKDDVLDHVVNWEGLIHYGDQIRSWVTDIYGIDFEDENLLKWIARYNRGELPDTLPTCKLSDTDGNVYNIIGAVKNCLVDAGKAQAEAFSNAALAASDYAAVVELAKKYCDVE